MSTIMVTVAIGQGSDAISLECHLTYDPTFSHGSEEQWLKILALKVLSRGGCGKGERAGTVIQVIQIMSFTRHNTGKVKGSKVANTSLEYTILEYLRITVEKLH